MGQVLGRVRQGGEGEGKGREGKGREGKATTSLQSVGWDRGRAL